jgi:hypothetical protein
VNKFVLTIFFLIIFATISFCQEASYKPTYYDEWAKQGNVLEIFGFLPGFSAGLRYETRIDDGLSAAADAYYNVAGGPQSYGGRLECNFYPQSHSPNAWFAGPFAGGFNMSGADSNGFFLSLGAQAGYRWIFDSWTLAPRVLIQYGMGLGGNKGASGAGGLACGAGAGAGKAF